MLFYFVDANYNSGDGTEVELFGVIVIPILAVLLLFNFLWIYLCLNATQSHLYEHRETYKVGIYKQLRKVVLVCALTVPLFTFYLLLYRLSHRFKRAVNTYWNYKWLVSDAWPNTVYLFFFISVAYLFQPSSQDKTYATSKQLPQDEQDDEFELETIDNSHEDDERATLRSSA